MRFLSVLYFLLLAYIIAAILFWGHSLDRQNGVIFRNELESLREHVDSISQHELYQKKYADINDRLNARKRQYLGEGATFLLIILIGAGVVYTSIRSKDKLSRQQTNFMLSITHELKSPIAAVKLNLQTLSRRKLAEDVQQKLIERSITEANRLDDLCNNLLLASQMESRRFQPATERIDFSQLVADSVHMFRNRAKNVFRSEIAPDCITYGDPLLWQLAVNNLLENAVKYTPPESLIKIVLQRQDEQLILSVMDEGTGIPDEEKGKIFRKFYRIGNESSRKTKGTGLGLYLTSKIIDQFNGTISVSDNKPKGSIFEITLNAS